MIAIKAEVKAEVMAVEEDPELLRASRLQSDQGDEDEENLTGEGSSVVHGQVELATKERAELFQPDLDQQVTSILCSFCPRLHPISSLHGWREHCEEVHLKAWFRPTLLPLPPNPGGSQACPQCGLTFTSSEEVIEHIESTVRTVRLVCPQCDGQYGDLEQHLAEQHGHELTTCTLCREMVRAGALAAHHQARHQGFPSVLAESVAGCAGDGIHMRWQETVLATQHRFSADEVKPAPGSSEVETAPAVPAPPPLRKGTKRRSNTPSTPLRAPVLPPPPPLTLHSGQAVKVVDSPQLLFKGSKCSPTKDIIVGINGSPEINSERGRWQYNVQVYKKFKRTSVGVSRNECEICGFVPYTKNKYREKQDHLAKFHFKERIDAVMPTTRPYACPDPDCNYLGKDKQDVLRHYTGKHNILKMWVDAFIKEQSGASSPPSAAALQREELLTFSEMEGRAIAGGQGRNSDGQIKANGGEQGKNSKRQPKTILPENQSPATSVVKDLPQSAAADLPKVVLTADGQRTSFTISKVSRGKGLESPSPPSSPSTVSLIRLSRATSPSTAAQEESKQKTVPTASSLLLKLARTSTKPLVRQVQVHCKFCADEGKARSFPTINQWKDHCLVAHSHLEALAASAEPEPEGEKTFRPGAAPVSSSPTLMEKPRCASCNMNFPNRQALGLHKEVCQEIDELGTNPVANEDESSEIEEVEAFEEISIKEEMIADHETEPLKKKTRRPPPALIPIL